MKKVFLSVLTFSVVLFTIYSCTKEEKYSCDNEIDCWVKENKDKYAKISRDELVSSIPFKKQIPLWRSFSNEHRAKMYDEKLQRIKVEENLTRLDIEFVDNVKSEIKEDIYSEDKTIKQKYNELDAKFQKYAIEKLGWTKDRYIITFHTFVTKKEMETEFDKYKSQKRLKKAPQKERSSCDCYYNVSCIYMGYCNDWRPCGAAFGCGVWGNTDCSGTCSSWFL